MINEVNSVSKAHVSKYVASIKGIVLEPLSIISEYYKVFLLKKSNSLIFFIINLEWRSSKIFKTKKKEQ